MILTTLALAGPLILSAASQIAPPAETPAILDADDAVHRAARLALTGDLGLAPLPPLTADSPLDSMVYADRLPVGDGVDDTSDNSPVMMDGLIPAGPGGTGTSLPEVFKYQLPVGYDPVGPDLPLIVAYHGFGSSANSVGVSSTIDEEANARSWIYVAPTGIDDKLFGSPISQQHVEVVIQWMIDNFTVDVERIYMVGFSMGGGIVANFASRHRDPGDIMIAAVGCVSGTLDWTQTWVLGDASLKSWMENSFNFSGNPSQEPFNYQQASALHFDPFSYPPLPGVVDPLLSMASNLEQPPTYLTYDSGDTLIGVPAAMDALETLLISQGATTMKTVQSGTTDPLTQLPAPHSWAVLDEVELFDFFEGVSVGRYPADFDAMLDLGGEVSWVDTTQATAKVFTYIDGSADANSGSMTVTNVVNASDVVLDAGLAGLSGIWPAHVTTAGGSSGYRLRLTGFDQSPSYLLDATSAALITLVDSDPATGSLIVDVAANSTLDVNVVSDPSWLGVLTTSPNPTGLNQWTAVVVDLPATSAWGFMVVAAVEQLYTVKGLELTALAAPPAIILTLQLDTNGDSTFTALIPNDAALLGLRLPMQAVGLTQGGQADAASNLWGFTVQ